MITRNPKNQKYGSDVIGFILNEGMQREITPSIVSANKEICKFKVDVMQEGELENRNKRIYPWDILYEGCNQPYVQERLQTRSFYCEIGHPREQTVERQTHVDRENSASMITSLAYNKPFRFKFDVFQG